MKNSYYRLSVLLILFLLPLAAQAKEKLVLLPVRFVEDPSLQPAMEGALVEGLQQKYQVIYGEEVQKKAMQIASGQDLQVEKECDDAMCTRKIVMSFNTQFMAVALISRTGNDYLITFQIKDILTNQVVADKVPPRTLPCAGCNPLALVDKLKEIVGTTSPAASKTVASVAPTPAVPAVPAPSLVPVPKVNALPPAVGSAPEDLLWNELLATATEDDMKIYLQSYPKGKYAAAANTRLQQFAKVRRVEAENLAEVQRVEAENKKIAAQNKEIEAWNVAEIANTSEAYQRYVNDYPDGQYAAVAKLRIKKRALEKINPGDMYLVSIPGKSWKIMQYEVTFAQWDTCVAAGGCAGYSPDDQDWGRDNRPVINVSYDDIQTYIQWLNQITGKTFRLPTEEEWEYAARGGTTTDYWWGEDVGNNNATCDGCGSLWDGKQTAPVGSFKANLFGLYDTAGNVWEWTERCNDGDCSYRVAHGGSWFNTPVNLRVSSRRLDVVANRSNLLGFRLVQDN